MLNQPNAPPTALCNLEYISFSSSKDGKNQSSLPPKTRAVAVSAAETPQAELAANRLVFVSPVPIAVPDAPVTVVALVHNLASGSAAVPLQPTGAASKYLPVVFPVVDGVINTSPPPGPVWPIEQIPPAAQDAAEALKL